MAGKDISFENSIVLSEYGKSYSLYKISDVNVENKDTDPDKKDSIFYKMINSETIEGFEKVYSDQFSVIYKIKQ